MIPFELPFFRSFEARAMISTFRGMSPAAKTHPLFPGSAGAFQPLRRASGFAFARLSFFFLGEEARKRFSKGCDLDEKET